VNQGHEAFAKPLLGNPWLAVGGEAKVIGLNKVTRREDMFAECDMRKCARISEKPGASSNEEDEKYQEEYKGFRCEESFHDCL
jgi:hypothetical protein